MAEQVDRPALNAQRDHWESMMSARSEMFGTEPSYAALKALALFQEVGAEKVLELGGGQGRDTLFLARSGIHVHVLDYARPGLESIERGSQILGVAELVDTAAHDVREPLPVNDASFDACFSHMLYCMALTTEQLHALSKGDLASSETGRSQRLHGPQHRRSGLRDGHAHRRRHIRGRGVRRALFES